MGDAVTGPQLVRLLKLDGWVEDEYRTDGLAMTKPGHYPVIVPIKKGNATLPDTILGRILSVKQSGLGKAWLREMIKKHGVR